MTHLVQHYGLWILFAVVALESAGFWLPGETALVTAGVLAARGHLPIAGVIAVAALAAIVGDNAGYWIGRTGGRKLLGRWPWLRAYSERVLPPAERFFQRHGGKTVFLARFVAGLRVTGAWMAGISQMTWWRFFAWNALGGVVWATGVGLVAYYLGRAAADAIQSYGVYGVAVVAALVAIFVAVRLWRRQTARERTGKEGTAGRD
jgi:membrane protein DedA with SNARE-associated domain